MIWHWLNVEYWAASWPNIFAPSVWVIPAVVISHVKQSRERKRHLEELKRHVTDTHGGSGG